MRKRPTFQDVYGNIPQTEYENQDESPGIIRTSKKCPYLEICWSVFSRVWTKYGDLQGKSPYFSRKREKYGPEKAPNKGTFCVVRGSVF